MNNSAIGGTWDEMEKELFTPEEIAASDLRVNLIGELIKARQEKGISQKEINGLIAGIEKNPQWRTVLRVLASVGKTLAVVPLQRR